MARCERFNDPADCLIEVFLPGRCDESFSAAVAEELARAFCDGHDRPVRVGVRSECHRPCTTRDALQGWKPHLVDERGQTIYLHRNHERGRVLLRGIGAGRFDPAEVRGRAIDAWANEHERRRATSTIRPRGVVDVTLAERRHARFAHEVSAELAERLARAFPSWPVEVRVALDPGRTATVKISGEAAGVIGLGHLSAHARAAWGRVRARWGNLTLPPEWA
jgi:hypothetical protein